MEIITAYLVHESDGDRHVDCRYYLTMADAKLAADQSGGYSTYAGPVRMLKVPSEEGVGYADYYTMENVTLRMGHIDVNEMRQSALARLSRGERLALGLSEDA